MSGVHVVLVSDQLLPNLIPALMERPEKVLLLATREMDAKGKATRLQGILEQNGMQTELVTDVPSAGLAGIREFAFRVANRLGSERTKVVLNATGGNKLMSLAFVEEFKESLGGDLRIIYTDTAHDDIETLHPGGTAPVQLESVLDIPLYLQAQGMTCRDADSDDPEWVSAARERKALTKYLGTNAENLGDFFGAVNRLAHKAVQYRGREEIFHPDQEFSMPPHGRWAEAMQRVADQGLAEWDGTECIAFRDRGAARYLGGFWLEEYVWHIAGDCGFDDVRCGVEATLQANVAKRDAPRNEFDLLVVHDNRMLVVECKTLRLDDKEEGGEQAIINKLENLGRNAGGTFGTSLLVSARRVSERIRNRCRNQGIVLREAGELKDLRRDLLSWKEGAALA